MSQQQQHIVGIHYTVGPKIGEGSFGVIFEGENILNNKFKQKNDNNDATTTGSNSNSDPVAIKFEPRHSDAPQLRDEFRSYKILNKVKGIPHVYYFGQEGMHNILIIDLLGPSLEDLFEWCNRKFSIKTTCMLAKQMIQRIKDIHNHDLIYRDIKPDNFLISQYQKKNSSQKGITRSANGDPNLIYLVDFGMAKQYRDPKTKQHIPYRERKSLSGTARYMSINTHFGKEQSRRDDLESLGHVFFYFLRSSLPWQGLKAPNNKLKYEKIGLTKQKLNPNDLLVNYNNIPRQFATFLKYARSLKFEQDPDYDYLISLMDDALLENGLKDDGHYDWMDLNNGHGWDININKRINLHGYGNPNPNANANTTGTPNQNLNLKNTHKNNNNINNKAQANLDQSNINMKMSRIIHSTNSFMYSNDDQQQTTTNNNRSALLRSKDYSNSKDNLLKSSNQMEKNKYQSLKQPILQSRNNNNNNSYDSMSTRIKNNNNYYNDTRRQQQQQQQAQQNLFDNTSASLQNNTCNNNENNRSTISRIFSYICCGYCCLSDSSPSSSSSY
ncbi:casein kinase YCK3 NDAI_0B02430 [Naumovozyma dairenensis CBS 421]|uniref:non-specific serine/threonine protein kinase n=1 Tax=Naumovozyma dairenensis (strain ATCC 10597 / BCRC 20456 / CBS 421 / NBRC 0211 / NRRL Y-12639) TaxID=1071378 RepID=G0W667_NAUDC|nr:hypothetical protein NDAI_0B02430 [Naumovozyma dairenensis CBS 421]CCD23278.1 hypothetical protein NDAI_0B02430 [Naumovozyma dairenensis CBS 421]